MMVNRTPKSVQKQQGVVLIVVVLAIVLMTTLLAIMIEDQHMFVRRLTNQKVSEQGYQYTQANRTIDYLGEDWAKFGRLDEEAGVSSQVSDNPDSFSLERSTERAQQERDEETAVIDFGIDSVEVTIEDLQGRYNLNNLSLKEPQSAANQKRIFQNLLSVLEIGEFDERDRLYGALVDWIDENDLSSPNGFESGDYGSKVVPYFAADQKLTSIGELRFVEGFNQDIINKLKSHITVLPVETARININTTTPEVLASLNGGEVTDLGSVTGFLAQREQDGFQGFSEVESAATAVNGASIVGTSFIPNMMQVNSQFFQINAKVTLGNSSFCMTSLVLRESPTAEGGVSPKVTLLSRHQDTLCEQSSPTIIDNDDNLS